MQHLTLQTKATATELGEFSAIAAAYSVDRGNERIIRGAFEKTITSWQASGKQIPLHWDHSGDPKDIIGTVDPMSLQEVDEGLLVAGRLDLEASDVAKDAWRLMKANSMGLSFGYMVTDGAEAEDGVFELKSIDLFEISITPSPMNPDTKVLATKSEAQLRKEAEKFDQEMIRETLPEGEVIVEEVPPLFSDVELKGVESGVLKSAWSLAYVGELPDTAFLHEREYPYRDHEGNVDIPHLHNAMSQVPNSELSQDVKGFLVLKAQEILKATMVQAGKDEEPPKAKSQPQDPLKQESRNRMLEVLSGGASLRTYKKETPQPEPEYPSEDTQRRRLCDLTL